MSDSDALSYLHKIFSNPPCENIEPLWRHANMPEQQPLEEALDGSSGPPFCAHAVKDGDHVEDLCFVGVLQRVDVHAGQRCEEAHKLIGQGIELVGQAKGSQHLQFCLATVALAARFGGTSEQLGDIIHTGVGVLDLSPAPCQ
jgi:hypothetical protein